MFNKRKDREDVYEAATTWRDKCLLKDGSLFGSDSLWTKANFNRQFAEMFDTHLGVKEFIPRLQRQVQNLGSVHRKLAVEVLWVMYLASGGIGPSRTKENLEKIAKPSGAELPEGHELLQAACLRGVAHPGQGYANFLWFEMMCFILCVREIKHLAPAERKRLLVDSDGKEFSRLWDKWPENWRTQWSVEWWDTHSSNARMRLKAEHCRIRHMMMHLLFPDHFMPIFSSGKKDGFVRTLSLNPGNMSWTEKDEALLILRAKKMMSNISLNQIFYGPPGTGKTYHTVSAALEILDNKFYQENKDDRKALKKEFDKLKTDKRVGVVTFHQSFGYEEFVEGIRPLMNDESENVSYEIKDGIFKKMCDHAGSTEAALRFDDAVEKLKRDWEEEPKVLKTSSHGKKFAVSYRGGASFWCKREESAQGTVTNVGIGIIKKFYRNDDAEEVYNLSYVKPIVEYVKEYVKKEHELDETVGGDGQDSPHVLIIDEINRGNISRIFGELITLIEESKRIGEPEETKVELPYSGDTFGVPKNLYIIGTMNTADRSIALLDTALRRRFRFVEMMPEPELLDGIKVDGIEIKKILESMNARIEALYDRDHQIGHSYFMRLPGKRPFKTLADIFQHEVLPLLQEYFYDDWEKIDLVLNKNGFLLQRDPPQMPGGAVAEGKTIWEINSKVFDEPRKHADHYRAIYDNAARDRINKGAASASTADA